MKGRKESNCRNWGIRLEAQLVFLAILGTLQSLFVAFPRHSQVLSVMITSGDTGLARNGINKQTKNNWVWGGLALNLACRLSLLSRGVRVGTIKGISTPGAVEVLALGVAKSRSPVPTSTTM